jgi:hypothetical protein
MVVLQGMLITAIALFVMSRLPASTPLTQTDGPQQVHDFVLAGNPAADPLIEVVPGVIVRSSSVRGLRIADQTYYYYYEGRQSYDPLTRGAVQPNQVELLLRDTDAETTLVVYRVVDR